MSIEYRKFSLILWFVDGGFRMMDVVACDIQSALADVAQAYGGIQQYSYSVGD